MILILGRYSYIASLATGDVDGDGNQDIILSSEQEVETIIGVLNAGDGYGSGYGDGYGNGDADGRGEANTYTENQPTIKVLLGQGDGTFAEPIDYPVNNDPDAIYGNGQGIAFDQDYFEQLIVEDFNQDSHLDVIGIDQDYSSIKVFLNDGSGGLSNSVEYETLDYINLTNDGDFNSDGILDLIIVGYQDNLLQASVLLGVGDGTFSIAENYELNDNSNTFFWSDLNSDNTPDLVSLNSESEIIIPTSTLISAVDGTFFVNEDFSALQAIANNFFSDLDSDDIPEIISVRDDNNFSIWQSNSDNVLSAREKYTSLSNWSDTKLSDLNGDELLDSVLVNDDGTFSTWLKQSDLAYSDRTDHILPQDAIETFSGDLDGDGLDDTVTLNEDNFAVRLNSDVEARVLPSQSYPTRSRAYRGFLEDFNNDGNLDFISISNFNFSLWLGVGDGTFGERENFSKSFRSFSLPDLVDDINYDGYPDLLLSRNSLGYHVRLNQGDGTFIVGEEIDLGNNNFFGATLADLDGDGKVDLVSTVRNDSFEYQLKVSFGQGDGTFAESVDQDINYSYDLLSPRDIDGDGDLDLIAADDTYSARVAVFTNQGDGTFVTSSEVRQGRYIDDVRFADLDQDGIEDLITSSTRSFGIAKGQGDGTFALPDVYYTSGNPSDFLWSDIDNDDVEDFIAIKDNDSSGSSVHVFESNGDGTFANSQYSQLADHPGAVSLTDVNGDGLPDFVTNNDEDHSLLIALNDGNGSFTQISSESLAIELTSIAPGDVNEDSIADLITFDESEENTAVYLGDDDGSLTKLVRPESEVVFTEFSSEDFNQDGISDLAFIETENNQLSLYIANEDGSISKPSDTSLVQDLSSVELPPINLPPINLPSQSETLPTQVDNVATNINEDINGDGIDDLISIDSENDLVSVELAEIDGSNAEIVEYSVGNYPTAIAAADLDHDGSLDLVVTNLYNSENPYNSLSQSDVSVLWGKGDGTFEDSIAYSVGRNPVDLKIEDYDQDGYLDLLTLHHNDDSLTLLAGSQDGTFTNIKDLDQNQIISPSINGRIAEDIQLKDINNDNYLDIVGIVYSRSGFHYSKRNIAVLLGKSDNSFGIAQVYPFGGNVSSFDLGDVNDDGILDLIATNGNYYGGVSVSLGIGAIRSLETYTYRGMRDISKVTHTG